MQNQNLFSDKIKKYQFVSAHITKLVIPDSEIKRIVYVHRHGLLQKCCFKNEIQLKKKSFYIPHPKSDLL